MNGERKNIIYTAADIEAYFSGNLPPDRMHAMEKDALDDSFLAEAMEGYEAMQGRSWKPQLVELHRHFEEERSPAKVIPLNASTGRWWKVAAAVLVIGCGATITWMFTNKKTGEHPTQEIAKTTEPATQPPTSPITESTTTTARVNTPLAQERVESIDKGTVVLSQQPTNPQPGANGSLTAQTKTPTKTESTDLASIPPKQVATEETRKVTPPIIADEKDKDKKADLAALEKTAVPANNGKPVNTSSTAATQSVFAKASDDYSKKAEQKPAVASNSQAVNHNFIAQVVGPDNTPLPFANVTIKNEDFGTYADVKGNFRLVSTDSFVNVEVRSVGYLPRTYTLRSSLPQNRIVLAEDENTARERAVVTNNGMLTNRSARRAGVLKDSLYVNVEPADGWENYNAYIRNSIDIPQNALKKELHGEVEVSFKVHPNGDVSNITVSQSDCADCAELAKRLVEQGPQWKIKKGIRKSSGRIKVQF